MSYIARIEPPDYLTALVRQTREDDAALLAEYGPIAAPPGASAELLRALIRLWPDGHFDEVNVAVEAPHHPQLRRALAFLGPLRWGRCGGGRRLVRRNERDISRWLLTVVDQEIDGLRLVRNPGGWCTVLPTHAVGRA